MSERQISASVQGVTVAWDTICTLVLCAAMVAMFFVIGVWATVLAPTYVLGGISFAAFKAGRP